MSTESKNKIGFFKTTLIGGLVNDPTVPQKTCSYVKQLRFKVPADVDADGVNKFGGLGRTDNTVNKKSKSQNIIPCLIFHDT